MRRPLLLCASLLLLASWLYGQGSACRVDSAVTLEQWSDASAQWGLKVTRSLRYDSTKHLQQIATRIQSGVSEENLATASFRETYQYDQQGRLTERLRQRYQRSTQSWLPDLKEQTTYTPQGGRTLHSARWQANTQGWQPIGLKVYRHNEAGQLIEEAHYRLGQAEQSKVPLFRAAFRYLDNHQIEATEWQANDSGLIPSRQTSRCYDRQERLEEEQVWQWDTLAQEWVPVQRTQYDYLDQQTVQSVAIWQDEQWQEQSNRTQTVDPQGRIARLSAQQMPASQDPASRREWTYQYESSPWSSQEWSIETEYCLQENGERQPVRRISREYLDEDHLVSVIHREWEPDSQNWQLTYRMERERPQLDVLDEQRVWSTFRWDAKQQMWLPHTQTRLFQTCEEQKEAWVPAAYPHLQRNLLSVDTREWAAGNCTVRLLDLSGKQVRFFQGMTPPQSLEIDLNGLPAGIYLLMAQTPNHRGTARLWIE